MERRGHPVGGAIAGFVFFFFLGLTLMLFGVIPLDGPWLALPLLGIVVGAIWGTWAPFGRQRPKAVAFVPTIPLGEPTGQAWTVRPVTGEVPVTSLTVPPVPVEPAAPPMPEDGTQVLPPVERPPVPPVDEPPSTWAP